MDKYTPPKITIDDIYKAQRNMRLKSQRQKYADDTGTSIKDPLYDLRVQLHNHDLEKIIEILGFEKVELYIRKKKIDKLKKNSE